MKCPYNNFDDCILEKCPACNYKEIKQEVIEGKYPQYMSLEKALEHGCAWKSTKIHYEFVSCKLVENKVQPVPADKKIINNTTETNVLIRKSIF